MLYNFSNSVNVNRQSFKWILHTRLRCINCGLLNIWDTHEFPNHKWLVACVKQKLSDLYLNEWYSIVSNSSKCKTTDYSRKRSYSNHT